MKVTLQDLEIRYKKLREQNPKIENCSVAGCKNLRDVTPLLGVDTSCAYHRLLFDWWLYEVMPHDFKTTYHYMESQKGRRRAFTNWMNKLGKEGCNKIVLKLANDGINWEC